MEVVSAIIGPIVESLIVPAKQQLGYLFSSTKHVRGMNTILRQLDGASRDVKKQMDENNINNLEIPDRVPGWLEEVEKIKEDAQRISSTGNGCFSMKMRYQEGKKAFKITEEMACLIDENSKIIWRNTQKPLGKVNSKNASTSARLDGDAHNHFKSREKIFNDALGFLQQDHKIQMIAICGMGGVGKTTMMEQLKRTTEDKKMFDYIVKVVIGQKINMFSVQQAVAEYMGQSLTETSKTARADHLRMSFGNLPEGKRKVLVILDDIWEPIELKDMGLTPLPNGFKLLLTSRSEYICNKIAIEAESDLTLVRVDVMEELEAQNFFWQIAGVSKQYDRELNQIGSDIVRRCGFLPLAIKLIATTLKSQEAFVWRNTFQRLKKNNIDKNVQEIVEISYNHIKEEEEKSIFLLCGLFPDDFNIQIEDLTRYAWGLQLLEEVSTLADARDRTMTCVNNLTNANLLIDGDYIGDVKMHDLVLAFVLGKVSKGDLPWMINHDDTFKCSAVGMSESCKSISITCTGMSEFPRDFRYPNVSLLRLTDGEESLSFSEDFYERMENLEVVAYEKMQYPLFPRSLQCSTKLRTLLLDQCMLMFDCSVIGELLNLEVLSFADSGVRKLPYTIGYLKKLKLLDLTGCVNLRIDDGVLKNLVNLEELYMSVDNENAIRFTDGNREELAECSKHLSALEVEFFDTNSMPENMFFVKLKNFKISVGRNIQDDTGLNMHTSRNTLMLLTNKDELLESRVYELFEKTEMLYLEVEGMNDIEEILVESVHCHSQSFNNLTILDVFNCENLRYLFTVPMANGLMKLERLTVSQCPVMEALVNSENGGDGVIKFQKLKILFLDELPELVGLCNTVNIIELPQLEELRLDGLPNFTSIYPDNTSATSSMFSNVSANQPFLNKEVLIPKLKILKIYGMNNLKEIWPYQFDTSDEVNACMLREIEVNRCDKIVNLFPRNPLSFLRYLKELFVSECGNIEVLFNIDTSCVGEIEEYNSNLRHIHVQNLGKLKELWRRKGESSSDILIRSFQSVRMIKIEECENFVNVFTPTITSSHLRTLMNISVDGRRRWEERSRNIEFVEKSQEINVIPKVEISDVYGSKADIEFSVHPKPTLNQLEKLDILDCKEVEVVFEIESSSTSRDLTTTWHNQQPVLLPSLKLLWLRNMEKLSHVWKCNRNKLVIPQNQTESSFHNLTTIYMSNCNNIKYLFSPLMGKLLPSLKEIILKYCDGIEEVVSNRYDEIDEMDTSISSHTSTSFPHLERLELHFLPSLKSINGGNVRGRSRSFGITSGTTITTTSINDRFNCSEVGGVTSWFLCQYSKKIYIRNCGALPMGFPYCVSGQLHKLEELIISRCESMMEVFESEGVNKDGVHSTNVGDDDTCTTTMTLPRSANMTLLQLPNLTVLKIYGCKLLEHIFTSYALEGLKQLKEFTVEECRTMRVIVKEDGEHTKASKVISFPRLKSLTLANLPNVNGFFLGMNEFRWPSLEKVKMYGCPQLMILTSGHSVAPKLTHIHTGVGKHSLACGLNFHLSNATDKHTLSSTPNMIKPLLYSWCFPNTTNLVQFPWSFSNLVEVDAQSDDKFLRSRISFTCNELLNLKNLEKLHMVGVNEMITLVEEVFEVVERKNADENLETQSVVVFEKLKNVILENLFNLSHIWKTNRWIVLSFPNLTTVSVTACPLLGHVFTCCMVGSLLQLQELHISDCEKMDVIVKQVEGSEARLAKVVFPCLKSITLHNLPNVKGFCLGKEDFLWPSLDTLEIKDCPKVTVFTCGQSTTPELKLINATFGLCHATEDPNSFIRTKQEEGWQF
ncbi:uncharacterized protein LOC111888739 [Lactuca sativa]|uniref:uncharacterized protein LOC111888739 n=1 Tax=Lactuca sativa TaxID=4236 RepID=UPI001C690873|nr:uncharacterized protein LOC111888739 [Lactuca sativa]